jgi:hypothetical protein
MGELTYTIEIEEYEGQKIVHTKISGLMSEVQRF